MNKWKAHALCIFLLGIMISCTSIYVLSQEDTVETTTVTYVNWDAIGNDKEVNSNQINPEFQVVNTGETVEIEVPENDEVQTETVEPMVIIPEGGLVNYASHNKNAEWTVSDTQYIDLPAPVAAYQYNAKTYMKFQTLGYDSWNRQGHLARQAEAYTGEHCLRMIDGRILIAVGSFYCTTIGTYIDVLLEDGTIIPCIMGDAKSDRHTDPTHAYQRFDKSVIEFIVDSPGRNRFDYSYFKSQCPEVRGNFSNLPEYSSPVMCLRIYNKVYPIDMTDMSNDNPDGR